MQMLNVLILVSIGLSIINVLYKTVAKEWEAKNVFANLLGFTFLTLAAVFGGSWALAIGVIFGVASNFCYCGNEKYFKEHPIRYLVCFVMGVLYIIAVLNYNCGGVVEQVASNGVLMVK